MRYYFHVAGDHKDYEDKSGGLFLSLEEAMVEARTISDELATDGEYEGYNVTVVDEKGNLIDVVPVRARLH